MALGVFAAYIAGQAIYMGRQWSEEELKAKKIVSVDVLRHETDELDWTIDDRGGTIIAVGTNHD